MTYEEKIAYFENCLNEAIEKRLDEIGKERFYFAVVKDDKVYIVRLVDGENGSEISYNFSLSEAYGEFMNTYRYINCLMDYLVDNIVTQKQYESPIIGIIRSNYERMMKEVKEYLGENDEQKSV